MQPITFKTRWLVHVIGAVLLIAALLAAVSLSVGNVQATPPSDNPTGNGKYVSSFNVGKSLTAERDWTAAEMQSARPYPLYRASSARRAGIPQAQPQRSPVRVEGGLPMGVSAAGNDLLPSYVGTTPLPLEGYAYPPPFSRYENFDTYTVYPYVTIGKLFFTQYGVRYACSAASSGGYAIWTAGHCAHAGDGSNSGWSYNVVFVPAYKDGAAPKGQWKASFAATTTFWATNQDWRYDYAGFVLKPLGGLKLSQKVGWLGFAYDEGEVVHWMTIGYPAEKPFNGKRQQICASSYAHSDLDFSAGPYPMAAGCDQSGGSSGGPWIEAFTGKGTAYINGHVSYVYSGYEKELYSPYYDADAFAFRECLKNSTPKRWACQ